jgi:hypothetical protein
MDGPSRRQASTTAVPTDGPFVVGDAFEVRGNMVNIPDPFTAQGGGVKLADGSWVPKDHPLAQSAGAQPSSPSPIASPTANQGVQTAQQAVQAPATVGAQPAQGSQTSVASAYQQALLNRLAPGPVSAQSPEISGAIAANRGAEQRGMEQTRATLAERAASQGLDQNAFNSQLAGAQQQSAGRQSQFEGNATLQLAQQRANDLSAALALGGSMLSDVDKANLQRELADLQAQISREGLSNQLNLGSGDLALRQSLGEGQLNLGLLNALLGNQQFGQNLSAQLGMFNASLNGSTLLDLWDQYSRNGN